MLTVAELGRSTRASGSCSPPGREAGRHRVLSAPAGRGLLVPKARDADGRARRRGLGFDRARAGSWATTDPICVWDGRWAHERSSCAPATGRRSSSAGRRDADHVVADLARRQPSSATTFTSVGREPRPRARVPARDLAHGRPTADECAEQILGATAAIVESLRAGEDPALRQRRQRRRRATPGDGVRQHAHRRSAARRHRGDRAHDGPPRS
jgi:hypothetical protein